MKKFLFGVLAISFLQASCAQKIEKLLLSNDSLKLNKVIEKNNDLLSGHKVMVVNDLGDTLFVRPLLYAQLKKSNEIVHYLLNHKELLTDSNDQISETFIHSLSEPGNPQSQLLFDMGANPNYVCSACNSNNAIMVAAAHGNEEWYFKLKKVADLKYKNDGGVSLLHCAASGPSMKIATDVFGSKKFDMNAKTKDGMTALDYAAWNTENHDIFEKLLVQGANINLAQNILEAWPFNPNEKIFQDNVTFLRRADLWQLDENGMVPVLWAALPKDDGSYTIQQVDLFNRMIDMMLTKEQLPRLKQFRCEAIYIESIAQHLMNAFELRGDFSYTVGIYDKFLALVEYAEPNVGWSLLDKKDFKRACKLFGQEKVKALYDKHSLYY